MKKKEIPTVVYAIGLFVFIALVFTFNSDDPGSYIQNLENVTVNLFGSAQEKADFELQTILDEIEDHTRRSVLDDNAIKRPVVIQFFQRREQFNQLKEAYLKCGIKTSIKLPQFLEKIPLSFKDINGDFNRNTDAVNRLYSALNTARILNRGVSSEIYFGLRRDIKASEEQIEYDQNQLEPFKQYILTLVGTKAKVPYNLLILVKD